MSPYGSIFAKIYNADFTFFPRKAGEQILNFYEATETVLKNKFVLDLCCGTGQLALCFLERGYKIVGIDLSQDMLYHARENTSLHIKAGRARFIHGDATNFTLDERFGLVVSTYDSLNHLESEEDLRSCFQSVFPVLIEEGYFIFDLNTRFGLLRRWNGIIVTDNEETTIINRAIFDEKNNRALRKISGFVRNSAGLYERFDEVFFNTVFDMDNVRNMLLETGWKEIYFAKLEDLSKAISAPEKENRVFIVAKK